MPQPETRRERMFGGRRNHSILNRVAVLQPEDSNRFHSHIMIGGKILHGRIRRIRDRARQDLAGAAVCVADLHKRNLHLLKRAVVIKSQPRKLPRARKIVDLDDRVHFLPRIPITLKPDVRLQQLDLKRKRRLLLTLRRSRLLARRSRFCWFCRRFLRQRCSTQQHVYESNL